MVFSSLLVKVVAIVLVNKFSIRQLKRICHVPYVVGQVLELAERPNAIRQSSITCKGLWHKHLPEVVKVADTLQVFVPE